MSVGNIIETLRSLVYEEKRNYSEMFYVDPGKVDLEVRRIAWGLYSPITEHKHKEAYHAAYIEHLEKAISDLWEIAIDSPALDDLRNQYIRIASDIEEDLQVPGDTETYRRYKKGKADAYRRAVSTIDNKRHVDLVIDDDSEDIPIEEAEKILGKRIKIR